MLEPDAVDRILLREAEPSLARGGVVVVLDDDSGALADGAAAAGVEVRSYHDSAAGARTGRRAGVAESAALDVTLFAGARTVLLRIPKGLAALDDYAAPAAAYAAEVELFAGGRIKHLSRGMNDTLARRFGSVRASLGQQKSRVLIAAEPHRGPVSDQPRTQHHLDLDLTLCAFGGTFAGAEVDLGSRFLVDFFDRLPSPVRSVVDLGSGSGLLGVLVAQRQPEARVIAVDDSRAACRSTAATAQANGVADRVAVVHDDRLSTVEPGSVDLVVCNPPFHRGTARDSTAAYAMIDDAARVLHAGGELWLVFNSHLPYLPALRERIGRTEVLGQNPKFTVARAVKRARPHTPHTS